MRVPAHVRDAFAHAVVWIVWLCACPIRGGNRMPRFGPGVLRGGPLTPKAVFKKHILAKQFEKRPRIFLPRDHFAQNLSVGLPAQTPSPLQAPKVGVKVGVKCESAAGLRQGPYGTNLQDF